MTLALVVVLGLAYPLLMTGAAQALFPSRANGSLARSGGAVIGSELIGQAFTQPKYFHPRPSAAGSDGYDPTASAGSGLGPSNPKLLDAVAERAKAYRVENDLAADAAVPVDAVTASGSGLDPDISVANAEDQAGRVARARGRSPSEVLDLVRAHTTDRPLGVLGERRVNVLELNLALDAVH